MCKRIKQDFFDGKVNTFTTGQPRGGLPNFDVSVLSPSHGQHRATELRLDFVRNGRRQRLDFDGRQARTLFEVLSRHFSN